jgi:Fe-S cluster assembly iron-binding protein IscA
LGMALDEPSENEQTVEVDGIDVLITDDVKPYASGNVLDWVDAYGDEGFTLQPESGSCC